MAVQKNGTIKICGKNCKKHKSHVYMSQALIDKYEVMLTAKEIKRFYPTIKTGYDPYDIYHSEREQVREQVNGLQRPGLYVQKGSGRRTAVGPAQKSEPTGGEGDESDAAVRSGYLFGWEDIDDEADNSQAFPDNPGL